MLKAVKQRRAYQDVVKQIIDLITKGRLKKGDQLPSERELTDNFQVSRTTVREAIRCLESMQLVKSRQGNGTFVVASGEDANVRRLCSALFQERDDIIDIFYIRKIVEPSIAELAAEYATSDEIKEMAGMIKKQEENLVIGENTAQSDTDFHTALARAAKNRVLGRLMHALMDLLTESRKEGLHTQLRAQESLRGHRAVFEAIAKGDRVAARESMRRHLSEIEDTLFQRKKGGGRRKI
jgi:GntR family transcriptional repressor for pyruvate dehydrogenase complex